MLPGSLAMLYTPGFMEGPCQGQGGGGEAKGPSYPQSHPQPQLTSISFVLKICQCVRVCGGEGDRGEMEERAFCSEKRFGNDWSVSFICILECCYQHYNFTYMPCLCN